MICKGDVVQVLCHCDAGEWMFISKTDEQECEPPNNTEALGEILHANGLNCKCGYGELGKGHLIVDSIGVEWLAE